MVDVFGFQLSRKHEQRDCVQNIFALNKELELYDPTLLEKPCVLLLNKMDITGASEILKNNKTYIENLENKLSECPPEIRPQKVLKFERIIPISAKNAARVIEVKRELRKVLDEQAEKEQLCDEFELKDMLRKKIGERGPKIT